MKQEYNRAMEQVRLSGEATDRVLRAMEEKRQGRRRPAKRRWAAAVAVAALVLMTGTAFAVAWRAGVLEAFFQGDTSRLEPYVQTAVDSAENGDYRLTVDSTINDGRTLYAVITVEGLNDRAVADLKSNRIIAESHRDMWGQDMVDMLMEDGGAGPMTFNAYFVDSGESVSGMGSRELAAPSDTSRSWRLEVSMSTADQWPGSGTVGLWLDFMGKGKAVQIPTDVVVETISMDIDREVPAKQLGGRTVYVQSLEVTPVSFSYVGTWWDEERQELLEPLVFFRLTDGQVMTCAQLGFAYRDRDGISWEDSDYALSKYRGDTVLDLSQIKSIILGDLEFPVDGSAPFHTEVDERLYPFQVELLRYPVSDTYCGYVADLADLCEKLGADYAWDAETKTATATYRGVTVALTAGSSTALVDGAPLEMEAGVWNEQREEDERFPLPAVENGGTLAARLSVFSDSWDLAAEEDFVTVGEEEQAVSFTITP